MRKCASDVFCAVGKVEVFSIYRVSGVRAAAAYPRQLVAQQLLSGAGGPRCRLLAT